MSSYLTRNKERFIFSHEMIWVPLRDLIALLGGQKTTSNSIRFNGRVPYFVNAALHYLARPDELEQVTVFDFYSKYDVVRVTSRNREAVFQFSKTASFTHPSYKPSTGRFLQGVLERNGRKRLPQVFQYDFPDPAEFCGHLLHSRTTNEPMEKFAQLALILFMPFRTISDLQCSHSFVKQLRNVISTFKESHLEFLQNIVDAKSNNFRSARLEDELQRETDPLKATDFDAEEYADIVGLHENEEQDDLCENLTGHMLDRFINLLNSDIDPIQTESTNAAAGVTTSLPRQLDLKAIKDKGRFECGYKGLTRMDIGNAPQANFIETMTASSMQPQQAASPTGPTGPTDPDIFKDGTLYIRTNLKKTLPN